MSLAQWGDLQPTVEVIRMMGIDVRLASCRTDGVFVSATEDTVLAEAVLEAGRHCDEVTAHGVETTVLDLGCVC